jgi:F-type H+-transporting ATPase subunit a
MESGNVMQANNVFSFQVLGHTIPISDSLIMMWIVIVIIMIFTFVFTRNLKTIPKGKQNVAELIVDTINNLIKGNIGHHWRPFAPYFGTILIFLAFSNTVSLFNIFPNTKELYELTKWSFLKNVPMFELAPPTKDINITVTMALMSVALVLFSGIYFKGIKGWLKGFLYPSPIMLPFHILDYGTRTLSLSLRLFGNMLAGYIILDLLFYQAPAIFKVLIPVGSGFFDIFDALLQAYIFVFLSSIYISEAVE